MRAVPDPNYAASRDALIPAAEAHADAVAGPQGLIEGTERWNRAFMDRMQELAVQNGLVGARP